jgi:hypothetical protein
LVIEAAGTVLEVDSQTIAFYLLPPIAAARVFTKSSTERIGPLLHNHRISL